MTHEPGHATDPNYDALPWETKERYKDAMKSGDPTKKKKHKNRPAPHPQEVNQQ